MSGSHKVLTDPASKYDPSFQIKQKPGRFLWMINRIPTWMYKLKLGRLLGDRFAMVVHRGRKSGRLNTVILELADGSHESGRLVYVSAYGNRAQWYLNLKHSPAVKLMINGKSYDSPRHEFLRPEATERAIASYWKRYPKLAAFLAEKKQYPYPGPVGVHEGAPIGVVFYLNERAR